MTWNPDGDDTGNTVTFKKWRCNCGRAAVTCGSPPATPCICSVQPQRRMKVKR
jgi:hypothetical protein